MAAVIWSEKAHFELCEIFEYWNERNKSSVFSKKLNVLIQQQLQLILEFPNIGKKTDIENVSVKRVQNYLLYYEFINDKLYILTIRHTSRNPHTLRFK